MVTLNALKEHMDDIKQDLRLASNFLKLKDINHIIIGSCTDNLGHPTAVWDLNNCGKFGELYIIHAIGELLTQLGIESKIKIKDTVVYCNYDETKRLEPGVN